MTKPVPHDVHAQCYKRSQLLRGHYLQNLGPRNPEHTLLANLLSPHTLQEDGPLYEGMLPGVKGLRKFPNINPGSC